MYMQDVHHELQAYYYNTYGTYNGKVVYVEEIMLPEPDYYDEDNDCHVFENDGDHDVYTSLDLFDAYVRDISNDNGDCTTVPMSEIDFTFPDTGLINVVIEYPDLGCKFNIAKYVTRTTRRQWRRALRFDMLAVRLPNPSTKGIIEAITETTHNELSTRITSSTVDSMFFPKYIGVDEALDRLDGGVDTYALSPDWWVGQGKHGIVFGHHEHKCGDVSSDGLFTLHEDLEFLRESFNETIGEQYAA